MFCHAGSYAAALSRIFNLAFPFAYLTFPMKQTGVSVIEFNGNEGELVAPQIHVSGNIDHLIKNNVEVT